MSCSFYWQFTYELADVAALLHKLAAEGFKLVWNEKENNAFENLPTPLTRLLVSYCLNKEKPFLVPLQTSCVLIEVVQQSPQKNSRRLHPVQYGSLTVSRKNRSYETNEHEKLTIIVGPKRFRHHFYSYTHNSQRLLCTTHCIQMNKHTRRTDGVAKFDRGMGVQQFPCQRKRERC